MRADARFPIPEERAETNALMPDQLERFLSEMKVRFPQHLGGLDVRHQIDA
jgi:hypothetical protein